jgi:hypothetical protein
MARDDSGDRLLRRVVLMSFLDGTRPSGIPEWVSPVIPVVTQAAVGAGHWAAGRRQRALAAWASAAGFGLVAACAGVVPAQIVVACGIFGNITGSGIQATVAALPSLCAPGALVL